MYSVFLMQTYTAIRYGNICYSSGASSVNNVMQISCTEIKELLGPPNRNSKSIILSINITYRYHAYMSSCLHYISFYSHLHCTNPSTNAHILQQRQIYQSGNIISSNAICIRSAENIYHVRCTTMCKNKSLLSYPHVTIKAEVVVNA